MNSSPQNVRTDGHGDQVPAASQRVERDVKPYSLTHSLLKNCNLELDKLLQTTVFAGTCRYHCPISAVISQTELFTV